MKDTRARSRAEVRDTVRPVLSAGSRTTRVTSMRASARAATQKSPPGSAPTLPRNATASPSRARPVAQMAEALPRVITQSSTTTSLPTAGKAWYPWRIRSGFSSPTTRTDATSGPPVDREALHHAADDAVVGGGVRAPAGGQATEQGEELAHQHVEDGDVV